MPNSEELLGYIAFRRDEKNNVGFAVKSNRDELEKWKSKASGSPSLRSIEPTSDKSIGDSKECPVTSLPERAKKLLDRFRKAMTSVHNLIGFTSVVRPLLARVFIEQAILPHVEKNLTLVEKDVIHCIYSFTRSQFVETRKLLMRFRETRAGYDTIPSATLLSLVATFDSYFSEIVRLFLAIHPERYTGSEQTMSLKEIFSMNSIEDVIDHVIDHEINDLMRGSHAEQVQFIESHLGVKIIDHYERWPDFVEIFERRNLVAHENLVVNRTYVERCLEAKCKGVNLGDIGATLTLSRKYLHNSVDILSEFGILLIFALWRKHIAGGDESAFKEINDVCYDLIEVKRPRLANRLLDFALHKQKRGCSDLILRMMIVNLANSCKKMSDDDRCQKVLASTDWSASKDNFQICIASLRGDIDTVVALMPSAAASNAISAAEFREWPVLDWVRDDPKVNEAFEKVYGEPMRSGIPEALTDTKPEANQDSEVENEGLSPALDDVTRH
jgi:hypothetical protein